MLHAAHSLFSDDLATGSSCSSLWVSGLPASSGTGRFFSTNLNSVYVHPQDFPAHLNAVRHGRSSASSFAIAAEEERREPPLPVMLVSYYKGKIKEMQDLAMKYSLKKIEAERDAFRAHDAEEAANQEAAQARAQAQAIDNTPDDSVEGLQHKIAAQQPKEEAVKDEVVASTNLLDADDRRDQAMKKQIAAMQKDLRYEQNLRAAMAEQKTRAERRNLIGGVPAVDVFGRRITTKESCEAQKNTIFHNGVCMVAGGDPVADWPTELAAGNAVHKDEEAIEQSELDVERATEATWAPNARAKAANISLKAAEADLARERAKISKDTEGAPMFGKAPKDQQHKIDVDQADLKKKEKAVADAKTAAESADKEQREAAEKLAKKKAEDTELRQQHLKNLKSLEEEQEKVEQDDLSHMNKADKEEHAAEAKFDKAEKDLSAEQTHEAGVLRAEADALQKKAKAAHGSQQEDLGTEAKEARKWQREAEWEADAASKHDRKEVAAENVAQKNAWKDERQACFDAERDAYTNGESADPDDDKLPDSDDPEAGLKMLHHAMRKTDADKQKELAAQQAADTAAIQKTFKSEKDAFTAELENTEKKAEAEAERNGAALREAETKRKIKQEQAHLSASKKAATSSLSLGAKGWPFLDSSFAQAGSHHVPAKLVDDVRVLTSEAPFSHLPIEAHSSLMSLLVPSSRRNFKHFL